jgi:hypothetical protein
VERVDDDTVLEAFVVVAVQHRRVLRQRFERAERRVVFEMRDTVVHLRQVLHRVALVVERRQQHRRRHAVGIHQRVGGTFNWNSSSVPLSSVGAFGRGVLSFDDLEAAVERQPILSMRDRKYW